MKCVNGISTIKERGDNMNKEKNYEELKKAINEVLGLGEAIGEITFLRILEAMPEDHSYDVYGFTRQE